MNKQSKEFEKVDKFIGIKNGKRSCIIKDKKGEFFRLKGYGNNKSGFTLLKNEGDISFTKIEIRDANLKIMFLGNYIIHIK